MQDLQYAACGFEIVLLGKWIFFFFYEFDLMTNGLSVYNGCQSRVSVETFCILNSWIYMYEKYFL